MNKVKCGICRYREQYIVGELWLKAPNCGNHCKSWIKKYKELYNSTEK